MFKGFNEDGEPLYDSKESAIERAKQMITWNGEPGDQIYIGREWIPRWFRNLVKETFLQPLAYYEYKG